jgi:formamidopyrimidine-DNA glycosylase
MPELPEVHTTSTELDKLIKGLKILDIWSGYDSKYFYGKNQIKDPAFFRMFKKKTIGSKIDSVSRKGKNVLIHLDNGLTILVHMKMTGHLLYGKYKKSKGEWAATEEGPLRDDKWNGWIRMVITLNDENHLALSDLRKFAKVTLINTNEIDIHPELNLGPDPLDKNFNYKKFKEIISKKPTGRIKNVLMDQELIAGIGNIYSDEALWMTGIDPETPVKKIKDEKLKDLLKSIKFVLRKGINFGGDSMSDYRTPSGEPGNFQKHHQVYQRKGEGCFKKDCKGKIERKVVGGRSSHYCPKCQS